MKFIYILEDDERTQKDLFETLQSIDPRLCIRFFETLSQFHDWLKAAVNVGPKALAAGGNRYKDDKSEHLAPSASDELRLVIANNELMGIKNMSLIERAREFFIRKKMCSEYEPTALILTAFDSVDFDISLAEKRIINNVIFKPFDKLILKQHIEYALCGHHPLSSNTVTPMNLQSTLEMLKELPPPNLSEIGFTTINNAEIKIGAFSKYYSESFKTEDKKSVFAFCKSSKQISDKEYLSEFRFFGIDNKQIHQIRKYILQNPAHDVSELKNTHGKFLQMIILDEDQTAGSELKIYLSQKVSQLDIYLYTNYNQLLSDIDDKDTVRKQQLPKKIDIIFANFEVFETDKIKRWEQLCDHLKKRAEKHESTLDEIPDLYLISKKPIQMDVLKEFSSWVKDVFFMPLDKIYLFKKLLSQHSTLLNNNPLPITNLKDKNNMKVANPVEITEISEAGLILKYYRAMSIGSFREFILWRPQELETPEIIGTVNFTEKEKDKGEFTLNHFVFFGMKDYFLKHIRLWLREAYIKTKEKD
ncbi:MAG: hypothetical protein ACXVCY_15430 [Pseudobdellovibrionaceae bacterium]